MLSHRQNEIHKQTNIIFGTLMFAVSWRCHFAGVVMLWAAQEYPPDGVETMLVWKWRWMDVMWSGSPKEITGRTHWTADSDENWRRWVASADSRSKRNRFFMFDCNQMIGSQRLCKNLNSWGDKWKKTQKWKSDNLNRLSLKIVFLIELSPSIRSYIKQTWNMGFS